MWPWSAVRNLCPIFMKFGIRTHFVNISDKFVGRKYRGTRSALFGGVSKKNGVLVVFKLYLTIYRQCDC